jgi:hypothetical protein
MTTSNETCRAALSDLLRLCFAVCCQATGSIMPHSRQTSSLILIYIINITSNIHTPGLPQRRSGFDPGSGHMEFVVAKIALGRFSLSITGFPYQFSFQSVLHSDLLSGDDTRVRLVGDVETGLCLAPPYEIIQ